MTLILELSPELESELNAEAAKQGLPLVAYALRKLGEGRDEAQTLRTGADVVAYWRREGVIGSRPDIADSQEHARRLRDLAERRSRE